MTLGLDFGCQGLHRIQALARTDEAVRFRQALRDGGMAGAGVRREWIRAFLPDEDRRDEIPGRTSQKLDRIGLGDGGGVDACPQCDKQAGASNGVHDDLLPAGSPDHCFARLLALPTSVYQTEKARRITI